MKVAYGVREDFKRTLRHQLRHKERDEALAVDRDIREACKALKFEDGQSFLGFMRFRGPHRSRIFYASKDGGAVVFAVYIAVEGWDLAIEARHDRWASKT